ncbi:MAG: hypothetical protein NT013_30555 [Planctomycetia bacterium]|nr:hypothetical protein [Planctomycetia bacterium]
MSDEEPDNRRHGTVFGVLVTLFILVALYALAFGLFWLFMAIFGPATP